MSTKKYRYETHLHTSPVSRCAGATAEENVLFYKSKGYDGIFVTNHFIDGNINIDHNIPYEERIRFYFSDYHKAALIGEREGLKVFPGVEMSYLGTDFLVYGPDEDWYLSHPEIESMKKSEELAMLRSEGALVIQAHPFREEGYIDHIRLFPRQVDGVEVINANRPDFQNNMAGIYAREYGLLRLAGSDNHHASQIARLAGVDCSRPLDSVEDFIAAVRAGDLTIFCEENK
ncbi:MAG: PHP domain-containing protein [Lachnospiraceae bacterium]|nr:PHP domain-containing protein [Lachnospiraceae bacterium]